MTNKVGMAHKLHLVNRNGVFKHAASLTPAASQLSMEEWQLSLWEKLHIPLCCLQHSYWLSRALGPQRFPTCPGLAHWWFSYAKIQWCPCIAWVVANVLVFELLHISSLKIPSLGPWTVKTKHNCWMIHVNACDKDLFSKDGEWNAETEWNCTIHISTITTLDHCSEHNNTLTITGQAQQSVSDLWPLLEAISGASPMLTLFLDHSVAFQPDQLTAVTLL